MANVSRRRAVAGMFGLGLASGRLPALASMPQEGFVPVSPRPDAAKYEEPLRVVASKLQPPGPLYVAISRDGSKVAAGGLGAIAVIWDAKDCHASQVIDQAEGEMINAVAFSDDGKRLATGGPARRGLLRGTPGGSATSSYEGAFIHLWEVSTGRKVGAIDPVNVADILHFAPNGELFAASVGVFNLSSWAVGTDRPSSLAEVQRAKLPGSVYDQLGRGTVFSDDARKVAHYHAGEASVIFLRDSNKPERKTLAYGRRETPAAVAVSGDGKNLAVVAHDHSLSVWDFDTMDLVRSATSPGPSTPTDRPVFLTFSPDGKSILSGGNDGIVRIWDGAVDRPSRAIAGPIAPVRAIAFRGESPRVVSGGWYAESPRNSISPIFVWDIAPTGKP